MKLSRIMAYLLYYGVARHLPVSYRPYAFGARLARYLCGRCLFNRCGRGVNIEHGADFGSGRGVEIGDYSGIGVHARIGDVTIGAYVMMAPEVIILSANHRFTDCQMPMALQGRDPVRRVTVEDDVWIGARAIILPGVRLGRGAIIGAGSVVTKDVAPYAIVAGNPARCVGSRSRPVPDHNNRRSGTEG